MRQTNQRGTQPRPLRETRFRHVLVCLDRSTRSETALPLATYIARINGARITLMHVLEAPPGDADVRATDALEWEIIREDARAYLGRWVDEVSGYGIDADSRIGEGPTAQRVAEAVSSENIDLLVISSRGENDSDSWPLGATARKILTLSDVPTLVVPSGAEEPVTHVPPERIFVPLDGSVRGECVLPAAIHIARESGAEIVLGHVVSNPVRTELLFNEEDLNLARQFSNRLSARAEEYLTKLVSQLEATGVKARRKVSRSNDPQEELIALGSAERADLVILSAHGATCNARTDYGSVASYVVAHSQIPVLIIHDLRRTGNQAGPGGHSRLPSRSNDATDDR